jgi:TRAP-type transport system periplasmic protein
MKRKKSLGTVILIALAMIMVVTSYTPAYSARPKEYKMAAFAAKTLPTMQPVIEMAEMIGKYTNNTVKIKVYGVDEIAGTKDLPALGKNGTIDFIVTAPVYYPTLFPMAAALQQLTVLNKGPESAQYAWRTLFKEFPELQKEFAGQNLHVLNRSSLGMYYTLSKKPIKGVADLKGMKVRNFGGKLAGEYLQAAGATPVFVPPADYYEALMRGVYDAFVGDMQQMVGFKLYENAKYLGMPTGSIIGWCIAMNLDRWNELTPSEQQAITRAATEWGAKDLAINIGFDRDGRKQLEAKGVQYIEFPEKDYAAIYDKFGNPWEKLKQVMKGDLKIDPAFTDKFVTRYQQIVNEYEAQYLKKGKAWTYQ